MKKIIKSIIFLAIFLIIFSNVFKVLWLTSNGIMEFYEEDKNSLDVIYIGASNAYTHFNPVLAYNEFGFTTGLLSNGNQQPSAYKYLLEEASKYQKPKIYIIDISYSYLLQTSPAYVRRVTDALKPSSNRCEAIKGLLKYTNVPKEEYINYYFSFLEYHNSYKNVSKDNFFNETLFKGHLLSLETIQIIPQKNHKWKNKTLEIPQDIDNIFQDLIDYIKKKKLNVIFVLAPKVYSEEAMGKLNTIVNKLEANDLKVWNLKYLDNLNIDYSKDLYNDLHLNVWGATKFTKAFAQKLKEKYKLPDHRDDDSYSSWRREYERFKDYYHKLTNLNFDDYLKEINNK